MAFREGTLRIVSTQPTVKNHHLLDPIENWGPTSRKNIRVYKNTRSHDRNQGQKAFLDRYLHWYLGLKEDDKRRPEIHDLYSSVEWQFSIYYTLWATDIGNKALHEKIRNDFWLSQKDFGNTMLGMFTSRTDVEGIEKHRHSYWTTSRMRYARKRKLFATLQKGYNYHTDCFRKLIPSEEYDFDGNVHSANNGLVVYDYSYIY